MLQILITYTLIKALISEYDTSYCYSVQPISIDFRMDVVRQNRLVARKPETDIIYFQQKFAR